MDRTTIVIQTEIRNQLRKYGRKEQTYNDIIKELLDEKSKGSSNAATLDDSRRRS